MSELWFVHDQTLKVVDEMLLNVGVFVPTGLLTHRSLLNPANTIPASESDITSPATGPKYLCEYACHVPLFSRLCD